MPAVWPPDVSVNYSTLRSALFLLNGRLYFNDAKRIYAYDPAAGWTETVYIDDCGRCLCGMELRPRAEETCLNLELSSPGGAGRHLWLTSADRLLPAA